MTREQTEQRAYEIWRERVAHGIAGTPEGDWEQAEREISLEEQLDAQLGIMAPGSARPELLP